MGERLSSEDERPAIAEGLRAIAEATAEYISRLAAAGADGIFYSNKCMRSALESMVDEWVLPLDKVALTPLRIDHDLTCNDSSDLVEARAWHLDMVLHCCGTHILYDRIVSVLGSPDVYPKDTMLSWNFEEGNPSLEEVLEGTSLRVWGTYPRALLSKAGTEKASVALESFLVTHRAALQEQGHLHRVVIGPDCCPGAFIGEEVPVTGWTAVQRAYRRWEGPTPAIMGVAGGA